MFADSADFTLDTTGVPFGVGGVTLADSGDFVLDTRDMTGVGGVSSADSADFVLDTTISQIEIGLRLFDGISVVRIACEPFGSLTSPLRISKNGTTYGVLLVDPLSSDASRFRVQTSAGLKALKKLP